MFPLLRLVRLLQTFCTASILLIVSASGDINCLWKQSSANEKNELELSMPRK